MHLCVVSYSSLFSVLLSISLQFSFSFCPLVCVCPALHLMFLSLLLYFSAQCFPFISCPFPILIVAFFLPLSLCSFFSLPIFKFSVAPPPTSHRPHSPRICSCQASLTSHVYIQSLYLSLPFLSSLHSNWSLLLHLLDHCFSNLQVLVFPRPHSLSEPVNKYLRHWEPVNFKTRDRKPVTLRMCELDNLWIYGPVN